MIWLVFVGYGLRIRLCLESRGIELSRILLSLSRYRIEGREVIGGDNIWLSLVGFFRLCSWRSL